MLKAESASESIQELIPRFYFPQFQPVVDVASGMIIGYESLIRCIDKSSNTVSASWLFEQNLTYEWIQLEIDRVVRRRAIRRFALDKRAGQLFLNVLPRLVDKYDPAGQHTTATMVAQAGIEPERVVIEITDTGGDLELVHSLIRNYKQAGFKVAINDLGLDISQLEYLMQLKPDYLKLQLADFRHLATAGKKNQVIVAMSLMQANKHMEILCEGIETEDDFFFAMDCGATKLKGWFFSDDSIILPQNDAFQERVMELKKYHADARRFRLDHHTAKKNIWAGWLKLIAIHHLRGRIGQLKFEALAQSGVTRYFVCSQDGIQRGASISFRPNGYFYDTSYNGENWRDRPYFPMTERLPELKRSQYLISNVYIDISTNQPCRTLSMLLSANTILFMDVIPEEIIKGHEGIESRASSVKLACVK